MDDNYKKEIQNRTQETAPLTNSDLVNTVNIANSINNNISIGNSTGPSINKEAKPSYEYYLEKILESMKDNIDSEAKPSDSQADQIIESVNEFNNFVNLQCLEKIENTYLHQILSLDSIRAEDHNIDNLFLNRKQANQSNSMRKASFGN